MHVGASFIFQNPGKQQPDHAVWDEELAMVDLVEPLGFESVWATEHHITDYIMCPDPVQFLAYAAGRTTTAKLGTMVVVLPWRDPFRVASQIAMLDAMSGGRVIFGMGRGAGRCEFEGFRVPMEESRPRFVEAAEMIIEGLESGYCEYDGEFYKQPRAAVRPRADRTFKGRTYAAAVSPESAEIMAKLGVGLLIIPQKPWDHVAKELAEYRALFQRVNGFDAPSPIAAGWTFVDESEERAYEMAKKYIGGYWHSVLTHYEFAGDHLKTTKGYEYYGKFAENLQKQGDDAATEFFLGLQVWGTPEMCYEKIVDISNKAGSDSFVGVFKYAGMPKDIGEANMRLFASDVLPELKKVGPAAERMVAAAA